METTSYQSSGVMSERKRDLLLVLVLLLVACGLRSFLLVHTEVPARDTIGFIRYALQFEKKDWRSVIRGNHQHPGYPLTVYAVSLPIRAWSTLPETETMSLAARLASNLVAVLLVIPMFYLGKWVLNRPAGFGGALLFQCLPVPAHVLSDGLSEPLYLFMTASALALGTLALNQRKVLWFFGCGLFCGLAYLTRPEGAILLASMFIVLFAMQWSARQRRSWREVSWSAAALLLAAAVTGSPYVIATGSVSNKPSVHHLLDFLIGGETTQLESAAPAEAGAQPELAGFSGPSMWAGIFGFTLNPADPVGQRAWKALLGMGSELVKSFHYVVWLPALLGVWWNRRDARDEPSLWMLVINCGLLVVVLCRLAVTLSYLSDRHLLLIVMIGCIFAGAALWEIPQRVQCWLTRKAWPPPGDDPIWTARRPAIIALGMLLVIVAASLPKSFDPLHANRVGYHAAGQWLASHADRWDRVVDDHCWAHYYAGCVLDELRQVPPMPPQYVPTEFVVVGRREREHMPSTTAPFHAPSEKTLKDQGATIVFHWPAASNPADASVVVYALGPKAQD